MNDAHSHESMADLPSPPTYDEFDSLILGDLLDRAAIGVNRLDRRVLELGDEELDTFFRPEAGVGRWSCRVLLGHLADADLVFVHRMRRTVGELNPVLALWDEHSFIDEGLYARDGVSLPVAGSVAVVHTLRMWHVEWLRSLPEAAWARVALHPERGELTLRSQVVTTAWHLEHHAWFLARKLEKLRPGSGGTGGGGAKG